MSKPNVLIIMTDQQRFDTIAALGASHMHTPNLDRLVRRGVTFQRGYSTCPVCGPARSTIRTGCEPMTTGHFKLGRPYNLDDGDKWIDERTGPYLAKTMRSLGYRTFGVGKFHSIPWNEDLGYDVHLHSEEMWTGDGQREKDAYRAFLQKNHPHYNTVEQVHGERSEMYYQPQMSPLPAELTVEAWAADRAVELIGDETDDDKPYFGFVSFIGPHPPFAPPQPFNRMYDPRNSPEPICGVIEVDHMDNHLPWMNYATWADNVDPVRLATLRARYYGEISYIDDCLGRILDQVESRADGDNTVIMFTADHGEHLGDHHSWQKESFFEVSCRVPYLVSWPARLPKDVRRDEIVCLADLFGIATTAAGAQELRDGIDVIGNIEGTAPPRDYLIGMHGNPDTNVFKLMVVQGDWKYIHLANGGREQLFNLADDPHELKQRIDDKPDVAARLKRIAVDHMKGQPGMSPALDGDDLRSYPFEARPLKRLLQMDSSIGVQTYSVNPQS